MDCRRRASSISLLSRHLSLLLVTSILTANSCSASRKISVPSSDQNEKVTLALYYETLCPYCSNFIVNYLTRLFDTGLISVVDLKLVPYGNAKIRSNNTITCQHGPWECLLNTIESCAIHVWPGLNEHFPFIYCIETLVYEGNYTQWESCFEKLGLDQTPITNCYNSGCGKELELQYAEETDNLKPPHKFVPWVTVDGEPLGDDYRNFISYICKAYKSTKVPGACSSLSFKTNPKEKENSILPVCCTEETKNSILSQMRSVIASWIRQVYMAAYV
ncbi:gamma-interferon-responsive lysosomal thiol protein-like [Cornus florida]|uniref:gamma-interferon-responsive lysosomal thiol protein-like n=1 Tax=Cornus florida TaxID=4283 RepID=UPI00289D2F2B|nr:gamma-interferon-responsive lysosomal thiol protein-like [Cornus florida]